MRGQALGIDLGGTQIKAVLVSAEGEVLQKEVRETRDGTEPLAWAHEMKRLAMEVGAGVPVGISAPGLASDDGRSIAHMPGRLHGLEGLDWAAFFDRKTRVPVANDAHCSLLAEAWIGAAKNLRDCFMLTLGTGVGGAIMADGRLLRGHMGRAGHLGHITLDWSGVPDIVGIPGSLEDHIGNHNILQRTECRFESTHALAAAFQAGDPAAAEIWLATMKALAAGISSLINVLDPEAVILGGGIMKAGDALLDPLRRELGRVEWRPAGQRVRLIPAELGEWAGAIGAARNALLSQTATHSSVSA